jgi:2'-5' RNA ligase
MRLFIAINFSNEVKSRLIAAQDMLKKHALSGNFTHRENLHLTLIFLGEIAQGRVAAIKQVIDSINDGAVELHTNGLGRFRRNGGDIWWIGIDGNPSLAIIYQALADSLTASGFEIEDREYAPHLTLARKVLMKNDKNMPLTTDSFKIMVDKISLMKSERINGVLAYTEIYARHL